MNTAKLTIVDIDEWVETIIHELPFYLNGIGLSIDMISVDKLNKYYQSKIQRLEKRVYRDTTKPVVNGISVEEFNSRVEAIKYRWLAREFIINYMDDMINETLQWCVDNNHLSEFIENIFTVEINSHKKLNDSFMQHFDYTLNSVNLFILNHLDRNFWKEVYLIVRYNTVYLSDMGDYRINYYHKHLQESNENEDHS